MNHRAATFWPIYERNIFLNAVVGLHLEAPPIGPERTTNIIFCQFTGNLVGLDAVMEGTYFVVELFCKIQNGHHFIRAIAVHVDDDVAIENTG